MDIKELFNNQPLRFRVWDKAKREMRLGLSLEGACQTIRAIGEKNVAISQSTGCKDNEGEELFTGDIVKDTLAGFMGQKNIGVVTYNGYQNVVKYGFLEDSLFGSSHFKKIGNIWEGIKNGIDK